MKKGVIWIFFLVMFSQFVLAAKDTVASSILDLLFGTSEYSILFLKAMLVVIIATMLYKPALNIFTRREISLLLTILIGFIGVRFMPESTITFLGRYIMIAVIAALPWFLGRFFLPSGWPQTIFIIASYIGYGYFLLNFSYYSVYLPELGRVGSGAEIFTDLIYMFEHYALFIITLLAIIAASALFIRFRDPTGRRSWLPRRRSAGTDGADSEGPGPDGAAPGARPRRNILGYLFVLALLLLEGFLKFSGKYYWAVVVGLILVAYFLWTSSRPFAQRSKAGFKRQWWKIPALILAFAVGYYALQMGQWWLVVIILLALPLIWFLGRPKRIERTMAGEVITPFTWGERIFALVIGGIGFVATYLGIQSFGFIYGILIGAGFLLILIIWWFLRSSRRGVRAARGATETHLRTNWAKWLIGPILFAGFIYAAIQRWWYISVISLIVFLIIWFMTSPKASATATRGHLRRSWFWYLVGIIIFLASLAVSYYIGWWAGAIGVGLLILIWFINSPKASTARGHVGTAGSHLRTRWLWYLAGIITLVASFAVTYYIGLWAGAIGLGLLILIWLFTPRAAGLRTRAKGELWRASHSFKWGTRHINAPLFFHWIWILVGLAGFALFFGLTYYVHWTIGVGGLVILIAIWFMTSSRRGVSSTRSHSKGHLLYIIFALIMIILTVINFIVPDPIPWIDEILMVGLDIYLIIKGID